MKQAGQIALIVVVAIVTVFVLNRLMPPDPVPVKTVSRSCSPSQQAARTHSDNGSDGSGSGGSYEERARAPSNANPYLKDKGKASSSGSNNNQANNNKQQANNKANQAKGWRSRCRSKSEVPKIKPGSPRSYIVVSSPQSDSNYMMACVSLASCHISEALELRLDVSKVYCPGKKAQTLPTWNIKYPYKPQDQDPNLAIDVLELITTHTANTSIPTGFKLFNNHAEAFPDDFAVYRDCVDPHHDIAILYLERTNLVHVGLSRSKAIASGLWYRKDDSNMKVNITDATMSWVTNARTNARSLAESLGPDVAFRYTDLTSDSYYYIMREVWTLIGVDVDATSHTKENPLRSSLPQQQDPDKARASILNMDELRAAGWEFDYPLDPASFDWRPFSDMSKVKILG